MAKIVVTDILDIKSTDFLKSLVNCCEHEFSMHP
jgi:hypothetical protein